MSVRAAAIPGAGHARSAEAPAWVPEAIVRACAEHDWNAALPPHAQGWRWRAAQPVKRVLDIVLAAAGLIVLAPLFVLLAVAIRLTSRGPVLYEWRVLGRRGRPFVGYKFRTMVTDADERKQTMLANNEMSGPVFKMRADPRITPVGRLLRKYSLDELPQLWSVLVGDMSLVGPRPVYPQEFAGFTPGQRAKLAVTPGITCLWQVSGRSEITDFERWMEMDLEYIQGWGLGLDLRILLMTVPAVVGGRGAY